jgi:type IV pilus assembly protein PilV
MRKNVHGFTLLEVLITVLILSLGMLGVGAALITVHRSTSSSYLQQQGVQLASDIVERMRQNYTVAQAGGYNVDYLGGVVSPPAVMCDAVACTSTDLAIYDLWQWQSTVNGLLPIVEAKVVVTPTATGAGDAIVTVTYNDAPAATALKSATKTRTVQLETLL